MIKRFVIAIILLTLVGGGLIGFNLFRDKMIGQFFANMPEQTLPVTTITVEPVTWKPGINAIGTANAAQGIDLTVEAPGIVREIGFTANQKVEHDQLLLRLDDITQVADLDSARTQLELAQTTLNRARQLQRRGVSAEANLETAEANFRSAEAALARAQVSLQTRRLVAPFGGTIGLPRVDPGSYVTPGTIIATLQDLDRMRVDFSLPEQELSVLRIGQPVTVTSEATPEGFAGRISGIDPRVDAASRMVAVRAEIEGAGGGLTPGQFVHVSVALPEETGAIALPQTAVITSLYGDYVYVVREREARDDSGQPQLEVRQVFVQPGRSSGGLVEVKGEAIKPGDIVVTGGQNRLSNGARVSINNSVTPDGTGQTPPPAADNAGADNAATKTPESEAAVTETAAPEAAPAPAPAPAPEAKPDTAAGQ